MFLIIGDGDHGKSGLVKVGDFSLISARFTRRNKGRGECTNSTNRDETGHRKVKISPHMADLVAFLPSRTNR